VRRVDQAFTEMLVLLAQQGERKALERLAARWRPRHYAHARRLLGSADGAGDAVQEAWAGIVRGIGRLREPGRFPAWSYAIVTRRCQDMVRRRAREPKGDPDADPLDPAPVDAGERIDLRRALAALPPDQRAAVALFYGEGLGIDEIAQALLAPAGTIKTRLFHARRALRARLEGDET
jgi:RNA polymerase sigma-70 factor (ECF subfamily)